MSRRCAFRQIRHGHHVHHHTGPAGKVLRPLSFACLGIILLPGEASPLPLPEHILNQILPQFGVHFPSLLLVRARDQRSVLGSRLAMHGASMRRGEDIHKDSSKPNS